jgi:hypothetical protein
VSAELKVGDRVEVVRLQHDPRPVPVGTKGEVIGVSRMAVAIEWDNGMTLGLALPEDARCYRKLPSNS